MRLTNRAKTSTYTLVDTTFIYALAEPGTKEIRYFGKANNPKKREASHIRDTKKGAPYRVNSWIRKLLAAGQRPDMHVLCEVPDNDWQRFECAFISLGKQYDFNLLNETSGGEGWPKGKKHKPETIAKLKAANPSGKASPNFGKKQSPEVIANRVAKQTGQKRTQEFCEGQRRAMSGENNPWFGKHHTAVSNEKRRVALLGEKNHNFGKPRSPQVCAKIRAIKATQINPLKGKKLPPDTVAKMRAGQLRRWANKRLEDAL